MVTKYFLRSVKERGWEHLDQDVRILALLLPMHWVGSEDRYKRIFSRRPPSQQLVISNRMSGVGRDGKKYTNNFNHCWFLWQAEYFGPTTIHWALAQG